VTSVGPVLRQIQQGLGLSGTGASILTMLPLLCFGLLASLAPRLAHRLGIERAIALAMVGLSLGLLVRLGPDKATLFVGTAVAACAIAIVNVLVPSLIKRDFAARSGAMMGLYTCTLTAAAALAAGATVPLGKLIGHDWRGALAPWSCLAVVGVLVWLPQMGARTREDVPSGRLGPLLRDPTTWAVTVYFGTQSLNFYALVSWLPTLFQDHGYSATTSGLLVSAATVIQVPVALVFSLLAARKPRQTWLIVFGTVMTAGGLVGILFAPTTGVLVWVLLIGIGQGVAFPVALTLLVVRTADSHDTSHLSAIAQTVGYVVAAVGMLVVGAVHDAVGTWGPVLVLLLIFLVPQLIAGLVASRDVIIGQ